MIPLFVLAASLLVFRALGALGLVVNAVSLWNTRYVGLALGALVAEGFEARREDVEWISPLRHEHINLLGRYQFSLPQELERGGVLPLRRPGTFQNV